MSLPAPRRVPPSELVSLGKRAAEVPVHISYGIIDRFSEGLYSSPNKAFEELVTNSYDAGAARVLVGIADDLNDPQAAVVVLDDGESMDLEGLKDLWTIGESTKRVRGPRKNRKPIGKFGIGKLATYVLAEELTYICKRGGRILGLTMDLRTLLRAV